MHLVKVRGRTDNKNKGGGGYFPDLRTQKDPDRLRLWDQVTYPDGGQT